MNTPDNLPRKPEWDLHLGWLRVREGSADKLRKYRPSSVERDASIKRYLEAAHDSWGCEILVGFDESDRTATFVSNGPDKKKGTNDDVICMAKGLREWDTLYDAAMFNYYKSWLVPEGLSAVTGPYLAPHRKRGEVECVRLIEPQRGNPAAIPRRHI